MVLKGNIMYLGDLLPLLQKHLFFSLKLSSTTNKNCVDLTFQGYLRKIKTSRNCVQDLPYHKSPRVLGSSKCCFLTDRNGKGSQIQLQQGQFWNATTKETGSAFPNGNSSGIKSAWVTRRHRQPNCDTTDCWKEGFGFSYTIWFPIPDTGCRYMTQVRVKMLSQR